MQILDAITTFYAQHQNMLFAIARTASVLALLAACLAGTALVLLMPIRIRLGVVRLDPLLKLLVVLGIFGWTAAAAMIVIFQPFIIIAKLAILNTLIVGVLTAWILLLTWPRISLMLTAVQQECELATNLTFLQAEMARSQLEAVNARIQQAIQPEEREVTETVLRTLSPLVTLFLKRERSVLKWSYAAVDVGKTMLRHFFSDKK